MTIVVMARLYFNACLMLVVGQVSQRESLFWYEVGSDVSTFSDRDHMPVFPDEALNRYTPAEEAACNNDPQCLFDTFETNDPEIGQQTLITNTQLMEQSAAVSKYY